MDRQQVLEALYAAFPEQPIVAGKIDFDAVHPSDRTGAGKLLATFPGGVGSGEQCLRVL